MKSNIIDIAHHRNGICGSPFHVVLFQDHGDEGSRKVGIVFESTSHVAVLDVSKLAEGDIAFASNSWRGDKYEPHLRKAIALRPEKDRKEGLWDLHFLAMIHHHLGQPDKARAYLKRFRGLANQNLHSSDEALYRAFLAEAEELIEGKQ